VQAFYGEADKTNFIATREKAEATIGIEHLDDTSLQSGPQTILASEGLASSV